MEDKRFVSKKELWMYALGAGGQGMIYAAMSGKISDYYTNVLQLPLMFVLVLMLFPMFLIGLIVLAIEFGGLKFTNELGR